MRIGLVVHSGREESMTAASEGARLLQDLGMEVVVARQGDEPEQVPAEVVAAEDFATDLDLAISFGGDGTFLRAAHLCRDRGVPVLGVNLGRLGFLAEIEGDEVAGAMRSISEGGYVIEERSTLRVAAEDEDGQQIAEGWALNEVSVEKSARQRLLLLDVHVGESLFAKVPSDGLVVASSTGSTAYALSAGGPIVSPELDAVLVVPVAPHSLFDRTLVVAPAETIRIHVLPDQAPAVVSCDGREPLVVPPGGRVSVQGGQTPVRLARVTLLDFYALIRRKFNLH